MSKLKLSKDLNNAGYLVNVFSLKFDQSNYQDSYRTEDPESDELTQVLAYSAEHRWSLKSEAEDCICLLKSKVKDEIFDDVELSEEDEHSIDSKIEEIFGDIVWYVSGYFDSIEISKDNKIYQLEVEKSDMKKIFLG